MQLNPITATLTAALLITGPILTPAQTRDAQTVATSGSGRLKRCWDLLLIITALSEAESLDSRNALTLGFR